MSKQAAVLPGWDEMSLNDRAVAVYHVMSRRLEGITQAIENFPPPYVDHPALIGLPRKQACDHAVRLTGGSAAEMRRRFGMEDILRLNHTGRVLAIERITSSAPELGGE